jgi:hypothetical protein
VGVQAVAAQHAASIDAGNRPSGVIRHEPELGARVTGGDGRVGGGDDAGDHPDQARLDVPGWDDALQSVDVVEVVDDDQPDSASHGELEFLVGLGVAVQHQPGGIGACGQCGDDLAAARDVEVQTFVDHQPLNGGAGE